MSEFIIYLTGPSKSGKNSVLRILSEKYGHGIVKSTTTRKIRKDDLSSDTTNISKEEFSKLIDNKEFLEYAMYSNEYYGTLKSDMFKALSNNLSVVKVIEMSGLKELIDSKFHELNNIDYYVISIVPEFNEYKVNEIREYEDKKLTNLFDMYSGKSNFLRVSNKGSLNSIAKEINTKCYNHRLSSGKEKEMLQLPLNVDLDNNPDNAKYRITFINMTDNIHVIKYLHSKEYINLIRYSSELHSDEIRYRDEYNIAFSITEYNTFVIIARMCSNEKKILL